MTPSHRLGIILVAISTLAWSTAGLFTRAADTDLATIIFWRGVFGTLGLAVVVLAFQGWAGFRRIRRLGRAGWAYVAVSGLTLAAYLSSLHLTSIAHVAVIYATLPFITAGLAWLVLREAASRPAIIAASCAFLGACVMVGLSREGTTLGDVLALVMTFGMAVLVVLARRNPEIPALAAGMLSTLITVLAVAPLIGPTLPATDTLVILAAFGLSNALLGFTMFLLGSARIPAIETALIGALEAPIAPLWVWLMFSETPSTPTLIGGAVVVASVLWFILREHRPAAPP